jgi:hypothetical protein
MRKLVPIRNILEQAVYSGGIEFCRPVPDDSPIFASVPNGHTINVDGILYVKESEWLSFLISIRDSVTNGKESV